MKLSQIDTEAGTQARHHIDDDTVKEYAERMTAGDKFPPIVVFHDGSAYYLADGFHRFLAAERIGLKELKHETKKGTKQDALWYAMGANKTNGIRMKPGDIRHAVMLALKTWPEKTQQAIADQVGCSQWLVNDEKKQLIENNKLTPPDKRTGADGKNYPTTYKRHKPEKEKEVMPEEKPRLTKRQLMALPGCQGMRQAERAIRELEAIEPNDTERAQAFDFVRRWLDANEKNETKT